MSATASPFGLRPVSHPSGTIRIDTIVDGIASAYNTAIYENTAVKFVTGGTLTVAAAGENILGVFCGCEFESGGKRFVQNYWPASQTYTAGTMLAKHTSDRGITYEIQGSGSYAQTAIGDCIDIDTTSGNTTTGISTGTTGAVQGVAAQLQVMNLAPYGDNAWGDAFTIVRVRIYEPQLVV